MHASAKKQRGFTLTEVLVALVVLSIGLLGMAGLQLTGIRTNHSAYLRTQATVLANSMADRMRANQTDAADGDYALDLDDDPCGNATTLAENDMCDWVTSLETVLPQGDGSITQDAAGEPYVITVEWNDERDSSNMKQFTLNTMVHPLSNP